MKRELELQIIDLYRRYPQPRSFAEEVELTAWNGVVINTEDFFMLARPVDIHDPEERYIAWSRRDRPLRVYSTSKLHKRCDLLTIPKTPSSHPA